MDREQTAARIKSLVQKFEVNKYHYLSKDYLEEEVKIDFINPFFEALGWDVQNTQSLSPYEREVVVEKGKTTGRPDYNFRIDGQTKFFVEVKAPREPLHKIAHVLQAKSYAWNTKNVFIVLLTDFKEFRLFDATIKPDPKNPDQGLVFELTYDKYMENLDKLLLLSKEEVEKGSLDKIILKDAKSKKLRIPVDRAFLDDLTKWREELAKDIYKRNIKELGYQTDEEETKINVKILNEAVQKMLDRLIFIRIAEDRKIIEPKSLLEEVEWWKMGGKRRNLQRRLVDRFLGWNQDFNGELLKPGACDVLTIDSELLADIIDGLYFPKCPYRFDVIGVELLGSIYEKYLGKTIRVTPKRALIEEKPEVRKAGGVYYTPQYIVEYIVKNTVGKIIENKTPKQIEKIRIVDPACGSGSFLLAAYQTLINYHLDFYEKHPKESGLGLLFPDVIADFDGNKRLSIEKKVQILRNNIFGVDIDPQAVEIAMMSLYLKCLEGEKDLPRKKELLPSLAKNIRCGNSLISYDIFDQQTLFGDEEKERINPFDWYSKATGFGDIMEQGGFDVVIGNPPYVRQELLGEIKPYFQQHYKVYNGVADLYVYFVEKSLSILKSKGLYGIIVSNKWMRANYGEAFRNWLKKQKIERIIDFGDLPVFQDATTYPCILLISKQSPDNHFEATEVSSLDFSSLDDYVKNNQYSVNQKNLSGKSWSLTDERTQKLIDKIMSKGIPLVQYVDNKIYYGIKTGLNKAFVIDEATKKHLIKEDPKSAEIIKPLLEGKDIKRYQPPSPNKYLIFIPKGWTSQKAKGEKSKWKWLKDNYPAIVDYLEPFAAEAEKRWDKGDYWWELRACEYYNEFEKPKIILPDISLKGNFAFDTEGKYYCVNTAYLISSADKYLLGILNSSLTTFLYTKISSAYRGGYLRFIYQYLAQLPIREINISNQEDKILKDKLDYLTGKMLKLNNNMINMHQSSTKDKLKKEIEVIDEKIDELVYELYGINTQERKIIEESIQKYR